MAVYVDRVKFTTTTTGTGTITVGSAATGFRTPAQAITDGHMADGDYLPYSIEDANGTGWEEGYGLYTASGTTLARSFITSSSNSGNAITLSAGTHTVRIGLHADAAKFKGCLLTKSGTQSCSVNTWTSATWDQEVYDIGAFHDTVTNNSRITIPAWVSKFRLNGSAQFATGGSGAYLRFYRDGTTELSGLSRIDFSTSEASIVSNASPVIENPAGGCYVEMQVYTAGGTGSRSMQNNATWNYFAMEVVQ